MIRTSRPDDVATTTTTYATTGSTTTTTESIVLDDVMQKIRHLAAFNKGAHMLFKTNTNFI